MRPLNNAAFKKMTYSRLDTRRINRRAKAKLGLLKSDAKKDYSDFMDDCMADMADLGMDEADAEESCQMIWDEGGGD